MNDGTSSPDHPSLPLDTTRTPAFDEGGQRLQQFIPTLLSIAKSTRAFLALRLVEVDLHPGQDQLLDRLEPGAPLSVSTLAEQLAVRPSTVSKMLDRLIQKKLVERASHSRDARRTMVLLTPAGEEVRQRVHEVWQRLESELAQSVASADRDQVEAALRNTDILLTAKLRRLR